ncbi:MAG TPA: hypothetical protein PKW59_01180 [Thermotogota bacterium]|nr:hypothetical protein [Thermotogota bacterium]HPH09464.1 hypothetical protein [Thermotogota bacterium]HPM19983.1 hypothetical protein [Thermotogota bacterium]
MIAFGVVCSDTEAEKAGFDARNGTIEAGKAFAALVCGLQRWADGQIAEIPVQEVYGDVRNLYGA